MKNIMKLIGVIAAIAFLAGAAAFVCERGDGKQADTRRLPHRPSGIYERYLKRPLDCFLATGAAVVLSPVLLTLTVIGAVKMRGNPFFTQERPGLDEKTFHLIKFRTMTNQKSADGSLLPDEERLIAYGKWLRSTSLDELPELFNIIKGDMSIIGPRPLLVQYLPRYNAEQRRRHEVRPGLTGLAQAHGRNMLTWEDKFRYDVDYVDHISLLGDIRIILDTAKAVIHRDGVSSNTCATMEEFMGTEESTESTLK